MEIKTIPGLSAKTQQKIIEAGLTTVEQVANTTPEHLHEKGVGAVTSCQQYIYKARKICKDNKLTYTDLPKPEEEKTKSKETDTPPEKPQQTTETQHLCNICKIKEELSEKEIINQQFTELENKFNNLKQSINTIQQQSLRRTPHEWEILHMLINNAAKMYTTLTPTPEIEDIINTVEEFNQQYTQKLNPSHNHNQKNDEK